jgi:hypothetical protein
VVDLQGDDVGQKFLSMPAKEPLGGFAESPDDAEDKEEGEQNLAAALEKRMHQVD